MKIEIIDFRIFKLPMFKNNYDNTVYRNTLDIMHK